MTEPEELDEDLFADLYVHAVLVFISLHHHLHKYHYYISLLTICFRYDQDDVSVKPAATLTINAPPEPTAETSHTTNGDTHDKPMTDVKEEPQPEPPEQSDQVSRGIENGDPALGWQDRNANGDRGNDYGDTSMDHESHGTGIKEDG